MKIYIAGPLFSDAERSFLEDLCGRLETDGNTCFLPHRDVGGSELTPPEVFAADFKGLREANLVVLWADGPVVDDGTACELGIFSELCRVDPARHRGVVALATDWRSIRREEAGLPRAAANLFIAGLLLTMSSPICTSVADVVSTVRQIANTAG